MWHFFKKWFPDPILQPPEPPIQVLLDLHNNYRACYDLPPLEQHPGLMRLSQQIVDGVWPDCSDGEIWAIQTGMNRAAGWHDPDDVFEAWVASPDHNRNLVFPYYAKIGLAHREDRWVVLYGVPADHFGTWNDFVPDELKK